MRITALILRTCTLTTMARGRWSLVTNVDEVARGSSVASKLLALCLNSYNNNNFTIAHKPMRSLRRAVIHVKDPLSNAETVACRV